MRNPFTCNSQTHLSARVMKDKDEGRQVMPEDMDKNDMSYALNRTPHAWACMMTHVPHYPVPRLDYVLAVPGCVYI